MIFTIPATARIARPRRDLTAAISIQPRAGSSITSPHPAARQRGAAVTCCSMRGRIVSLELKTTSSSAPGVGNEAAQSRRIYPGRDAGGDRDHRAAGGKPAADDHVGPPQRGEERGADGTAHDRAGAGCLQGGFRRLSPATKRDARSTEISLAGLGAD